MQGDERGRVGPAALAPIGVTLALLLGVLAVGCVGKLLPGQGAAWVAAEDCKLPTRQHSSVPADAPQETVGLPDANTRYVVRAALCKSPSAEPAVAALSALSLLPFTATTAHRVGHRIALIIMHQVVDPEHAASQIVSLGRSLRCAANT